MSAAPRSTSPEDPDASEEEGSGRPSYKARKAESHELGRLAKALVDMKPSALADLPLPDDLREVVQVARGMERAARVRELRRVVACLRGHGITSIDALERDAGRMRRQRSAREREYEAWRERLVSEGDRALAELVAQHPTADAQRLRQLVRQARRDPASDKGKQALRTVLRLVRQACEGSGPSTPPEGEDRAENGEAVPDELASADDEEPAGR